MVYLTRYVPQSAATASTAVNPALSRSKYASHIRKAFLLRVHPDRFRSYSPSIQKQQAQIVQQLMCRMERPDFLEYGLRSGTNYQQRTNGTSFVQNNTYESNLNYFLERKDGTLIEKTIPLEDTVENVLQHMVSALDSLGGVTLPKPPPCPVNHELNKKSNHSFTNESIHPKNSSFPPGWPFPLNFTSHTSHYKYAHKDRSLSLFLQNLSPNEITLRKTHRIDAHAAALIARRLFSFQSINGTRIHWSSHSLSKLFHNLSQFYEEHSTKFQVSSFYPLQLEMTNGQEKDRCLSQNDYICLYGGKLYLNPSSTPMQWLETIMKVDSKKILQSKKYQKERIKHTHYIEKTLGVQIKQGLSCPAKDYHNCLKALVQYLQSSQDVSPPTKTENLRKNEKLALTRIQIIIESCPHHPKNRRPRVTHEGHIQIYADSIILSPSTLPTQLKQHESLSGNGVTLLSQAQTQSQINQTIQQQCQEIQLFLEQRFGLHRIMCVNTNSMKSEEYLDCLKRFGEWMVTMEKKEKDENEKNGGGNKHPKSLLRFLVGQSVGITNQGQFCHLRDDGSIIIPSDFH